MCKRMNGSDASDLTVYSQNIKSSGVQSIVSIATIEPQATKSPQLSTPSDVLLWSVLIFFFVYHLLDV